MSYQSIYESWVADPRLAEADRAEAQRLREEMEKLKAQLAARQGGAEPQSAPDQDGPADKEEKG